MSIKNFITIIVLAAAFSLLAGCNQNKNKDPIKAEVGRGTFVAENGDSVTAIYYTDDSVRLHMPDKTEAELFIAVSGSGSRYTNKTAEWLEHQGEATYEINGKNIFRGKIKAPE